MRILRTFTILQLLVVALAARTVFAQTSSSVEIRRLDSEREPLEFQGAIAEISAMRELGIYRVQAGVYDVSRRLTREEERYVAELQARDQEKVLRDSQRSSRSVREAQDRLAAARRRLARATAVTDKSLSVEAATWKSPGFARCGDILRNGGEPAIRSEVAKGDVHCQYLLGRRIASEGRTDAERARGWSMALEAGEKGSPEGEYALGGAYIVGSHGKERSRYEAIGWFQRAAKHGHPGAVIDLVAAMYSPD